MKTIAQIAEEIGVSKQAIHQKIKKEPLSTDLRPFTSIDGNTLMIDVHGEELIRSVYSKERLFLISSTSSTNNIKDKLIETLQQQIDTLTDQNTELLKQLDSEREHSRQQSDRISDLAEKLAELTRNSQLLLKQEQDKNIRMLSDESTTENLENDTGENKKSFWDFWKKNKK